MTGPIEPGGLMPELWEGQDTTPRVRLRFEQHMSRVVLNGAAGRLVDLVYADGTVLSGTLHPVDATTVQIDGQAVQVDQVVAAAIW